MRIENTALPDVKIIHLDLYKDERGTFAETYDQRAFEALGIRTRFVQDSCSHSPAKGTIRGFHFQIPPCAQAKLVRVVRGRVFDVVVDLRRRSSSYGRHVAVVLDARDWRQLLVPAGFAHGFCTLDDDTEIAYKMSEHFSPQHYRGLVWDDPDLGIAWPLGGAHAVVSEKDRGHPRLKDLPDYFGDDFC
jgi:dTDP-4-dehydrorhamnose 3,5-epimerase